VFVFKLLVFVFKLLVFAFKLRVFVLFKLRVFAVVGHRTNPNNPPSQETRNTKEAYFSN